MKKRTKVEKIGVIALSGLCVLLVFKLVSEITSNAATPAQPESTAYLSSPKKGQAKGQPGKNSVAPHPAADLEMQALDQYHKQPLPDLNRNPFDFGQAPLTPAQKAGQAAGVSLGAMTASSAPAAPQIPLRAIGYSEGSNDGPEAYLVDSDDVFIVHDGDVVSKRFKVLKITPSIVEVQDGTSGERSQLPIPAVQ